MGRFHTYLGLLPTVQDPHGFVDSDECDSLLFSSLLGCVPGARVNIDAAFDGKLWQRRPCEHPCYPEHSKSTISRDMILGLLWYAFYNKRLDISESIVQRALSHRGVMGLGVPSRTVISPALLATAARVSYALGGPSRAWLRWIPLTGGVREDFEAHLHVLHMLLRNRLEGKDGFSSKLSAYADLHPNNALFQLAANRTTEGIRILNDVVLFPEHRLPRSMDRHEGWLWQRAYGSDWKPSDEGRTHSGADYLFAYAIAMEMI